MVSEFKYVHTLKKDIKNVFKELGIERALNTCYSYIRNRLRCFRKKA